MTIKSKEDIHSEEIEKVISIFRKSGIDHLQEVEIKIEEQQSDIDVLGIYNNIIILVECVGNVRFGPKLKKSLTDFDLNIEHFEKISEIIRKKYNAFYRKHKKYLKSSNKIFKKLFVSFEKETKESISKTSRDISSENDACIWTREEIYYYDKISDCTYEHCKYEIFDCLNINPEDMKNDAESTILTYLAYGKKIMNKSYLLNFIVPVNVLLHRSTIRRLQDSVTEEGYQRLLDKNKLKGMREYLLSGKTHMYPNNIICVLSQIASKPKEIGKTISDQLQLEEQERAKTPSLKKEIIDKMFLIELPNTYNVFEIIDGQHRLFSYAQTKYHLFEKIENSSEKTKIKREDNKIKKLSEQSYLTVTAIYSEDNIWGEPGKLFFDINTTQTRIKPEDVIDLVEKYHKDHPIAKANKLLKRLNNNGILKGNIKIKFWQDQRIKRTSLLSYSGLKDIFDERKKTHKIFFDIYKKQKKIKNYIDFCFILINNYLWKISNLVRTRYKTRYKMKGKVFIETVSKDFAFKKYYLFSAVFIGALIRLLRHFLSDKDEEFKILDKLNETFEEGNNQKEIINKNIQNDKIQNLFCDALKLIVKKYDFTKNEFNQQEGWGSNKWAKIESDLFYSICKKYPNFGDDMLISKKHRKEL